MSDVKRAVRELAEMLQDIALPAGLRENYDLLECLSCGHGTETFLARRKDTGRLCAVKRCDRRLCPVLREGEILRSLQHTGLPAFLDTCEDDDAVWVAREYVEGTPLDQYAAERTLSETQVISLAVQLCDILTYLHGQRPPVIHRDIKPQNLIVSAGERLSLIDFDIARTYDEGAETDTRFVVTRAYAPPEQYGFSQTDCRADIYSLGVLLCFLLTGRTDTAKAQIPNRRLAAVVRRCAAFAPKDRFASAAGVKKALLGADGQADRRRAHWVGFAAAALLCLCAGFGLGRCTDLFAGTQGVQFAEPLMEQAVRVQLGREDGAPLTREDLLAVREIYIFGDEVSQTAEAFTAGLAGPLSAAPRGSLTSLADLSLLPNLEVLYVNYQTLSDISPVSSLRYLREVNLRHTYVEDVSPLAGLPRLRSVSLFDTHAADLTALSSCPLLRSLDAGQTMVSSLDALPQTAPLESLSLAKLPLRSLEGIGRFDKLRYLSLHNTGLTDLSPLKALPALTELSIDETMRGAAEALGEVPFSIRVE